MRAAYTLLVVAALFFVGFVHNAVTGEATLGDAVAQLLIVSLCLGAFVFVHREVRLRAEFLAYLRDNVGAIRGGSARFRGEPVSYATELQVYNVVLSFVLVSVKLPTRFVIRSEGADLGLRVGCTLVSLLFGWWSIPWGPIWTLQVLVGNVRGATAMTVGSLLEGASSVALAPATSRG